jgi:hypothetical protein
MITKEQAMNCCNFVQIAQFRTEQKVGYGYSIYRGSVDTNNTIALTKPLKWKSNGKCKVWKSVRNKDYFRLPIKHGMYSYSYIEYTVDNDNRHLFEVAL